MWYAFNTIVRESSRFIPAIITVAACTMLLMAQVSIIMGILTFVAKPITKSRAHLWIGHAKANSYDNGRSVPGLWLDRVASQPGVDRAELYVVGNSTLLKPNGEYQACTLVGLDVSDQSLGAHGILTAQQLALLRQPGSIIANRSDQKDFEFIKEGFVGEVSGQRVYWVGTVENFPRMSMPYLFCSVSTAQSLLPGISRSQTTFILAHCQDDDQPPQIAAALRERYADMSAFTASEFTFNTKKLWFFKTKAGVTIGLVAFVGSLVALFITSQTLYSATVAARREYAVLEAMGIPKFRVALAVMYQSFWVGVAGGILAVPFGWILVRMLFQFGVLAVFNIWLVLGCSLMALVTAIVSGALSLRSLKLVEPAELLH